MKSIDYSKVLFSQSGMVHFAFGLVSGCTIAAVTLSYYMSWHYQLRTSTQNKGQFPNTSNERNGGTCSTAITNGSRRPTYLPADIRDEQLSRHTLYFGTEGMERLKQSMICIVGVGGVGSHTAHMIARSGVGYIRIIDFDQVSVSSLNRHACATLNDVGTSKVQCLTDFLRQICPDPQYLTIDAVAEMYTAESGERLLQLPPDRSSSHGKWDMVIDCIDDVKTKAALLAYCIQSKIPVVSCMGAGGKADPTRLHISDMRSAAKDPLATKIRQYLKSYMKKEYTDDTTYLDDMNQLAIIYNSEKTVVKLAEFTAEQKAEGVHNFGAVDGMRIRVVPVLGTMPAIMGLALASYCLTIVAGGTNQIQPVTAERIGRNSRNKMYQMLRTREQNITAKVRSDVEIARSKGQVVTIEETNSIHGIGELITISSSAGTAIESTTWIGELQIDQSDDMDYLLEIWRNRCAITGARLGTVLHVVRWDRTRPSTCDNLIVICANVLKQYEANPLLYQQQTIDPITRQSILERLLSSRVDR
jgi:tRNA threonylcarbamoyladenosine dehydratase